MLNIKQIKLKWNQARINANLADIQWVRTGNLEALARRNRENKRAHYYLTQLYGI